MASPAFALTQIPSKANSPDGGSGRIAGLDWLRVASILYVTGFWHLFGYTDAWPAYHSQVFYRITVVALATFVVISGFLVGGARVELNLGSVRRFWFKRLIRLFPPYILTVILFAGLHILGTRPIYAVLLVSMFHPPAPFTLWFITMIVVFYILAPFLVALLGRPQLSGAVVFAIWTVAWLGWLFSGWIDQRMLIYFPCFVLGIVFTKYLPKLSASRIAISVIAVTVGYLISLRAGGDADQSIWDLALAVAGGFAVFYVASASLSPNRLIEKLAYGSFFLYLLHRPIYIFLLKSFHPIDGIFRVLFLLCICFPVAVVAGILAQTIYDRFLKIKMVAELVARMSGEKNGS